MPRNSVRYAVYGEIEAEPTTRLKLLSEFDTDMEARAHAEKECFKFKSCPIFKIELLQTVTARDTKPVGTT